MYDRILPCYRVAGGEEGGMAGWAYGAEMARLSIPNELARIRA